MKPVLVWSQNHKLIVEAHAEAVDWGFSVGPLYESDGWWSFQIHATRAMPDHYKRWLSRGVNWLQITIGA